MRNLIYLFIGWLATATTASAQTSCSFGTLQVGSASDGTPICNACTPDVAECNEWFNCEITHDPRCNWLNCTDYSCNSDEVYADFPYNRFCAKAVPPGQYPVCEESDMFIASSEMCMKYVMPSADGCVEPDRPYTREDGFMVCIHMYPPQMRSCPSGYYMHTKGPETVCFTVRPAECLNTTDVSISESDSASASVSPRPLEKPSESPRPSEEPRSDSASETHKPSQEPRSDSASETPKPSQEPPSDSASVTPEPSQDPPSDSASVTPEPSREPPSETPRVVEKPSVTPKPSEEPPSETATATPRVQEKPSETPKPMPCKCLEPSILVRDVYCLWNDLVEPVIKCNEQDTYFEPIHMCGYIIEANMAEGNKPCPEGYKLDNLNEKAVCIKYYEPTIICPQDFVYIQEANRFGFRAGCYKVTNATCDSIMTPSATPRVDEKPSETPSATPRVDEKPSETPSVTPRVKPSTTATRTPRRSSTPTMTPKQQEPSKSSSPSSKPLPPKDICELDPRNPRCMKPDSILNQFAVDATIAPLPTFKPAAPPIAVMSPLPIPTPWAVPTEIVIAPEDIPPYIPSRMSFADGNPTQFEEPQKIQEIQASIACTLRMPLEKIRIDTITILTISTGERQNVAIDPSDYMMDSNGTVVCYQIAASARLLRALQSTDIQVDIDYLIVEPSVDVLSLNASQFAEILKASPVIQTFAQSVGSTGVASEVTVASYAGIQVPSTSSISTASSFKFPTYGIGILGGVGGLLVLASVGVGYYVYKKKQVKKQSPVQSSGKPVRVHFVDEVDIAEMQSNMPRMLGRQQSTRTHFNPLRVATVDIGSAV